MGKPRITQEQAEKRYKDLGLTLIDTYISGTEKVLTVCICGNQYYSIPHYVFNKDSVSCGCYKSKRSSEVNKIDLLGKVFGRLTVIASAPNKSKRCYWLCRCACGSEKIIPSATLLNGKTLSCGCYNKQRISETNGKDLAGQTFGEWSVLSFAYVDNNGKYRWKCRCSCGKERVVLSASLLNGKSISCGHVRAPGQNLKNDLSGQKFGKLDVIKYHSTSDSGAIRYECKCSCGRTTIVQYANLVSDVTKSCGNCFDYRNGKRVSKLQVRLQELVGGVLNFNYKNTYWIDVALARNGNKIAIEYDEWHWHRDRIEKDEERVKSLILNGWKVLTIRARNQIPSLTELTLAIEALATTKSSRIIFNMPDRR